MNDIIEILNKNRIDYKIGLKNDDRVIFYIKNIQHDKIIKIMWKKEAIDSLIKKFNNLNAFLNCEVDNEYFAIYNIPNKDVKIFIEYIVSSHVQLPKALLKKFKTNEFLYYIDTKYKKIIKGNARHYNAERGYYQKWFEDYLSNNYESIIFKLIDKLELFYNREVDEVEIIDLNEDINKLFFMAFFRNPNQVEKFNSENPLLVHLLGKITPEMIAMNCQEESKTILSDRKPLVVINLCNENFVTIKCLFSNLSLKNETSIFLSLHPKIGIAMVSNDYYLNFIKQNGQESFITVNDITILRKINLNIYNFATINNVDVIGKKEDLENILNN